MATYTTNPNYITDGELLTATILNRVPQQLQGNTDYLLDLIGAATSISSVIYPAVTYKSDVVAGTPVYWNDSNTRFEPASTTVGLTDVVGICLTKTSSTAGDLLLSGKYVLDVTSVIEGGDPLSAGWYFLAATTGKITATADPDVAIPILISDGIDTVYVRPTYRITPSQTIVAHSVACISTAAIAQPLYWNSGNTRLEPAKAGVNQEVIGICWKKPTSTTADVVLAGKVELDFSSKIEEGGAAVVGRYYLSPTTAGNVTATRDVTNIVPVFISDGAGGNIYVLPQFRTVPGFLLTSVTGTTADAYATIATLTNAVGLVSVGTIKNTGANDMTVKESVTDAFTVSDILETDVATVETLLLSTQTNKTTSRPPYTSYAIAVKSKTPGNSTTYSLKYTSNQ